MAGFKIQKTLGYALVLLILSSCNSGHVSNDLLTAETKLFRPDPSQPPASTNDQPIIEPYADVRGKDLSNDGSFGQNLIKTLYFDESTSWNAADQTIANEILDLGKNPGFGIYSLHEKGITGDGVVVGIIDQNLIIDHPEFAEKIIEYKDFGTGQEGKGSMHGPAVVSLLVGNQIGTAPGALVYYAAVPSWLLDADYYAEALDWLVEENEKLPTGNKIRVISISAAPSGNWSDYQNSETYNAAYQRAIAAGILVLDCTSEHGLTLACTQDLFDPDNISKCIPNWNPPPKTTFDRIVIPASRTTATEAGVNNDKLIYSYSFSGMGGLSWTAPYLAGVLAMGWQINPELTNSEIIEMLFDSAYEDSGGNQFVKPLGFISLVKQSLQN